MYTRDKRRKKAGYDVSLEGYMHRLVKIGVMTWMEVLLYQLLSHHIIELTSF